MRPAGPISGSSFYATSVNHREARRPLTPTIFPPDPILIPPRREQLPVAASRFVSTGYFGTLDSARSNIIHWKGIPRSSLPAIAVATSSNSSAFGDPNTAAMLVTSKSFPSNLLKARNSWRNDRTGKNDEVDLEARDRLLAGYDVPVPENMEYGKEKVYLVTNKRSEADELEIPLPAFRKEAELVSPQPLKLVIPTRNGNSPPRIVDTSPRNGNNPSGSGDGTGEHSSINVDGPLEAVGTTFGNLSSKLHTKVSMVSIKGGSRTSKDSRDRESENSGKKTVTRNRFGFHEIRKSLRRTKSAIPVEEKREQEAESFIQSGDRDRLNVKRRHFRGRRSPISKSSKSRSRSGDSSTEDSASTTKPEAPATKEERIKVGHFLFGDRPPIVSKDDPNARRISVPADSKKVPFKRPANDEPGALISVLIDYR